MRHLLICLSLFLTTTCFGNVNVKPLPGMPFVNRTHPLSRGLVGLWLFNEGSGNKVFDLSGNGNIGTFNNIWTPSKFGSGLLFANGKYVNCGNNSTLKPGAGNFSAFAWVRFDSSGSTYQVVLSKINNNTFPGFYIRLAESTMKITFAIGDGVNSASAYSGTIIYGTWYQVGIVVDKGSTTGLKAIVNGNIIGTANPTAVGDIDNDLAFVFACRAASSPYYNVLGVIDNALYFNRALSSSEIALLYREPFCFMQGAPVPMYAEEAPPAGGGQVIMIQMTAIPLAAILSITLALVFSRRRK